MNVHRTILVLVLLLLASSTALAQSDFNLETYYQYLSDHANMQAQDILDLYPAKTTYWTKTVSGTDIDSYEYMDSIRIKLGLTEEELAALRERNFVVSERLTYPSMGDAFIDVFYNDLPVFVSTDAVLHALHRSYDEILQYLEYSILRPKLSTILEAMYTSYPSLVSNYQDQTGMDDPLKDVDLFITMALSLLEGEIVAPQNVSSSVINDYWDAVEAEQCVKMPLFSETPRTLDFSQFTVRGHYDDWGGPLSTYFQAMMWLGRMDFLLANPSDIVTESDIHRMNIGAVLLIELLEMSGMTDDLSEIDGILEFMVGESDNLTIDELQGIISEQGFDQADDLLSDVTYSAFQEAVEESPYASQKILSNVIIYDFSEEPPPLPVSFRFLGQRFIIDSYILSKVVFPNIRYQETNIWRPMPDPLDAMFALGNDDAIQLLGEELDTYHYSTDLAGMRYLVDAYDEEFWSVSLYNSWLNSIRALNPPAEDANLPFFMQTTGWHQQKLNTQLASWAQLRHDNLLYAKQSYTGGATCYYPHGYVEPYPNFYGTLGVFASTAAAYFGQLNTEYPGDITLVVNYFDRFGTLTDTLQTLSAKELSGVQFDQTEEEFLKRVLTSVWSDAGCFIVPADGWYVEMFFGYNLGESSKRAYEQDYVVADVHTQPTDEAGNPVGNVLHVGVGDVNLGVYLVEQTHDDVPRRAYVGPAMSYYEMTTGNFERMTDQQWGDLFEAGTLPSRPDWVNVYLADSTGVMYDPGRELAGSECASIRDRGNALPSVFTMSQNYPNPFNPHTVIRFGIRDESIVRLTVYDVLGRQVANLIEGSLVAGDHQVIWNGRDIHGMSCPSGIYFYQLRVGSRVQSKRMVLLK